VRAPSADANLRVGAETGQAILVERVPAAPTSGSLDLLALNRCS